MAMTLKISENFYDDAFTLIALHTSLEDYALAYRLNESIKTNFRRCRSDLDISQNISFPIFEWKDLDNEAYWTLITNHSFKEDSFTEEKSLFKDELSLTTHYLLPEFKEVDFLLKIEQDHLDDHFQTIEIIAKMPEIIMAYSIETNKIKSLNNLIY